MQSYGITTLKPQVTVTTGDSTIAIPNQRGESVDSAWRVSASGYYQFNDYIIVNGGGVGYDGDFVPTGSFLTFGFDFAQLDVGYRDHWFSPLSDATSLIGTEAPTMPSITLSNYDPFSPLEISYEVFAAEMSEQEGIVYEGGTTSGRPRLAGLQLSMEPVVGYALGLSRITQYGGGARGGTGLSDFVDALLTSSNEDASSVGPNATNRVASVTSSILFPGTVPFGVHIEYAGEDNAYAGQYRLGATNLSLGIDLPRLWNNFDLTFEVSEWQNDWYVHYLYPEDGLTNDGHVIGHWFGDNRYFGDAIGGSSQMLRLGWLSGSGLYWQATYRTLANDEAWRRDDVGYQGVSYDRMHMLALNVSGIWREREISAELQVGQDVFGDSFGRLSAAVDFAGLSRAGGRYGVDASNLDVDLFVDAGAGYGRVRKRLGSDIPVVTTDWETDAHIAVGARRRVSDRFDVGVRLEMDRVDGEQLLSLRAVDPRFRLTPKIALGAFIGVGRYDVGLPSYGFFWGGGVQYMDVVPKWDLSLDWRRYDKLGRDKTLPSDPPSTPDRTRIFFDVDVASFYISRRW